MNKENEIKYEINDVLDNIITCIETGKKYKNKKYVSYDRILAVHRYIINRDDIYENNLKNDLWWSPTDFLQFYNEARFELAYFMRVNPGANKYKYSKTLWCELDFDKIYTYVILCGTVPIELVKIKINENE